jgi:hypothetical protein
VSLGGGWGVEFWFYGLRPTISWARDGLRNGIERVVAVLGGDRERLRLREERGRKVDVEEVDGVLANGESVERDVEAERRVMRLRTGVLGTGFVMGVVGVWGDGA